jgi:hypothetical protein
MHFVDKTKYTLTHINLYEEYTMSFENLKRNKNSLSKLLSAATDQTTPQTDNKKSYVDERQWKPTVDKAGNGYAVIRFLPAAEGNELPWVRYWDHGFKGPTGQWYIEKSLTSIGQADPVSEANSKLWNSGNDRDKEIVRERKRRLHYVSNVLVESDPANPANEGQVFLFTYGKKIFDKIMDVMQPEFHDEDPINPFDFWEGASFKLKIRNVEGYRNYDKSEFAKPAALSESDSELEEIYDRIYDLSEYTDPANYKSYDELAGRLAMVLGEASPTHGYHPELNEEAPAPRKTAPAPEISSDDGDEDDTMSYFAKLAAEE